MARPMHNSKFIIGMLLLHLSVFGFVTPFQAHADGLDKQDRSDAATEGPVITPIGLFRSLVSKADGDRCPMYPTCSHYASEAFSQKGLLLGWILTCDRLLRCGRDETRSAPKIRVHDSIHTYDPLSANTFWWDTP